MKPANFFLACNAVLICLRLFLLTPNFNGGFFFTVIGFVVVLGSATAERRKRKRKKNEDFEKVSFLIHRMPYFCSYSLDTNRNRGCELTRFERRLDSLL